MTGLIAYMLFFGFLCAFLADRKGYEPRTWFWLGILLGVIAMLILSFQPDKTEGGLDASNPLSKR